MEDEIPLIIPVLEDSLKSKINKILYGTINNEGCIYKYRNIKKMYYDNILKFNKDILLNEYTNIMRYINKINRDDIELPEELGTRFYNKLIKINTKIKYIMDIQREGMRRIMCYLYKYTNNKDINIIIINYYK